MPIILAIDDINDDIIMLHDYLIKSKIDDLTLLDKNIGYLTSQSGSRADPYSEDEQCERLIKMFEVQWDNADLFLVDMALRGSLDEDEPVSQKAIHSFLNSDTSRLDKIRNKEKFIIITTARTTVTTNLHLDKEEGWYFELKPDWKIGRNYKGGKIKPSNCKNSSSCFKFNEALKGVPCYQNDCLRNVIKSLFMKMGDKNGKFTT